MTDNQPANLPEGGTAREFYYPRQKAALESRIEVKAVRIESEAPKQDSDDSSYYANGGYNC
jgi:hypothetical protein